MWLFIISDALTFSALLIAYTYLRVSNAELADAVPLLAQHHLLERHDVLPALEQLDDGDGGPRDEPRQPQERRSAGCWPPWSAARRSSSCTLTEWMNLIHHEHVTPFEQSVGRAAVRRARSSPSPACT